MVQGGMMIRLQEERPLCGAVSDDGKTAMQPKDSMELEIPESGNICAINSPSGTTIDREDAPRMSLNECLTEMIERSSSELTVEQVQRLRKLVFEYEDIWRIDLEDDQSGPAKVTPLKLRPKSSCTPRRAPVRRYNRIERKFLESMTRKLLKNGSIRRNRNSTWSSPSFVVKKPGKSGRHVDHYRWTIDLRWVNSQCERIAGCLPVLEVVMEHLEGSSVYASLDAHKGYWQFPLHPDSQEMCSFVTHEGVFTPTRLLQGHQDSVMAFQSGMEDAMGDLLYKNVLVWIDDLLAFASDVDSLFDALEKIFARLREYNIKLNPMKTDLLLREVSWCGRLISAMGTRFDPALIQGLVDLELPRTAAELQQFLCAANWIRISIPSYASAVEKLSLMLKTSQRSVSSSRRSKLRNVKLEWDSEEEMAFGRVKELLANSVQLAHFRSSEDWALCLFTDASDRHWGVALTQCPASDLSLPVVDQRHEALAFLSGSFSGSQLRWSVIEKEAFPIIESLDRLRHYLSLKTFHLFTDHRNLKYIFSHYAQDSDVKKHVVDKLMRWQVKLRSFSYTIEHVAGKLNYWADLLSRWRSSTSGGVTIRACAVGFVPPREGQGHDQVHGTDEKEGNLHSREDEFTLLTSAIRGSASTDFDTIRQRICKLNRTEKGLYVVSDMDLKAQLIVLAHSGTSGHRGVRSTLNRLKQFFIWDNMGEDVSTFVHRCLHCLSVRDFKGKSLLGSQLHATEPNMILHYDFLTLRKGEYVLVIKDDFSHFVELVICESPSHYEVVDSLLAWHSRFGLRKDSIHISDQGTHFKNSVCRELERCLGIKHRFTPAHSPWSNGTVEVVNRHLLKCLRSLSSELRVKEWRTLIPLVQAALNLNPSPTLGGLSPTKVFTGLSVDNPISVLFDRSSDLLSVPASPTLVSQATADLQVSMQEIHRSVVRHKDNIRERQRQRLNRNRRLPKYNVGDFVLVHISKPRDKLSARYNGPWRVTGTVSDHVYVVEHLLSSKTLSVHVERLLFFSVKDYKQLTMLKDHIMFHKDASYEVEKLLKVRERDGVQEVLVQWLGFEPHEATWEPLHVMEQDVPELVAKIRS